MLTVLLLLAPAVIPSASGVKTGVENVPRTIPPPRQPNHASEPPANVHTVHANTPVQDVLATMIEPNNCNRLHIICSPFAGGCPLVLCT